MFQGCTMMGPCTLRQKLPDFPSCSRLKVTVTDSVGKMCVDPGETLTALQAGGDRGPGPPVWKKGRQLASASGKRRT
jgi:hypothetical protein